MHPLLGLDARPVIAHRGASGRAPENTIESLHLAREEGAEAIEFDVRLSADGVAMVVHDPTLERTTDRTGEIRQRTRAQLKSADAGYRFSPDGGATHPWRGRGVAIPTLREALEAAGDLPILVEIKTPEASPAVLRDLRDAGVEGRAIVASFHEAALRPFHGTAFPTCASRPRIALMALRSALHLGAPRGPERAYAVPDRYKGRVAVPTPRFVRAARDAGRPVHVWTVNDPPRALALWAVGVSGIITNFPREMLAARRAAPT